ncbi:ABC transporter permease [Prauserella flavalba]|uniref:ABC transporter permease n=1 Tax=Prauserella flavalba TaxID=1477506 RepID=UPI0036E0FE54
MVTHRELTAAPEGIDAELNRLLRGATRRRVRIVFLRIALVAAIIAAWQVFSGPPGAPLTLIDEFYLSRPTAMWDAARQWAEQGILLSNVLTTMQVTLLGFLIGAVLGMAAGFVLGSSPTLSAVFSPVVAALYAIPRLALIPLFLLWFGLGIGSKLALVITVVFFLVFYNTHSGVRDVDRELVNVLRVMQASRWHIHTKVTIPSAMNWIIAGLRVSVPYALVAAVTGEMTASNEGMGYLIIRASGQFNTAAVFAGIVVLMVLALLLGAVVNLLEKRLLAWKVDRLGAA